MTQQANEVFGGPGWWLASDGRWYPPTSSSGQFIATIRRTAMALPLAALVLLLVACGGEAPIGPVVVLPTTVAVQPTTPAKPATTVIPVTVPPTAPATTAATAPATTAATAPATARATVPATRAVSYANCTEVRNAGAAPIRRGQPGYSSSLDRDGDGIACET